MMTQTLAQTSAGQTPAVKRKLLEKYADKRLGVREIDVSKLFIDPQYGMQRPLNQLWVRSKAREFNPFFVGVLIVSKRDDGTYAILDGQHRQNLLCTQGYQKAECIVFQGLTRDEEIDMFLGLNASRPVARANKFAALAAQKQEPEATIAAALVQYGYAIDTKAGSNSITGTELVYDVHAHRELSVRRAAKLAREILNGRKVSSTEFAALAVCDYALRPFPKEYTAFTKHVKKNFKRDTMKHLMAENGHIRVRTEVKPRCFALMFLKNSHLSGVWLRDPKEIGLREKIERRVTDICSSIWE